MDGETGIPFGRYYNGISSGIGFGFTGHVAISSRIGVRVSLSRLGLRPKDDVTVRSEDEDVQIVNQTIDLDARRLSLGIVFYQRFPGSDRSKANTMSYVHLSACSIRHATDVKVKLKETSTGNTATDEDSSVSTAVGFSLGAGLARQISSLVALEFGVDLDTVVPRQVRSLRAALDSHGSVIEIHAGLAVVP
ncbi:MAG: hypothetical protein R3E12_09270 [Candidatus Eisenbacteria bacterium]